MYFINAAHFVFGDMLLCFHNLLIMPLSKCTCSLLGKLFTEKSWIWVEEV